MAAPRVDIAPDKQALKAASKALVRAGGGIESGIGRVGKSLLSEYGRPDNESFMPIDVVADFEDDTHGTVGHPIMTRHLAKRQGFTLVKLPEGNAPTGRDLHTVIAAHSRCANEVTSELIADLADGRIDPTEAARGVAKCEAAIEQLIALQTFLKQIVETV